LLLNDIFIIIIIYFVIDSARKLLNTPSCVCVCVCVCTRARKREREIGGHGDGMNLWGYV